MPKNVEFEGKSFSFPDDASDNQISNALEGYYTSDKKDFIPNLNAQESVQEGFVISGILIAILISLFFLKKLSHTKLVILYSVFQKILIITLVLFAFWMYRYEVTSAHPPQCLDRWLGKLVSCYELRT